MTQQRLYVVQGMGRDEVGLVGRITTPIAQAKGNIQDLRQDVLHGLFTIHMVVDLTHSSLEPDSFQGMVQQIGDETGLRLTVDKYTPVSRSPDKKSLLMILVGMDKPGIIAASSALLGKYNANIEFAQTIGREGIFLMELLTDVSHVAIPVENLKRTICKDLDELNIRAIFQDTQVFIKRKRIILFDLVSSFIGRPTLHEIMQQAQLTAKELSQSYHRGRIRQSVRTAAAKLDGLALDVVDTVLQAVKPTPGSMELIQTLKVMGYKIVLVSTGFSFFTDSLCRKLDIDRAYGIRLQVDDDARTLIGELAADEPERRDAKNVMSDLQGLENVDVEDITTITDEGSDETPGLRLDFDLEILLDCFNHRVMSKENLIGLLGSFGIPSLD